MIRLDPIRSEYKYRDKDGKEVMKAEIECDTLTELVGLTTLGNVMFIPGSRAHAIKDAEICSLAFDMKWYKQSDGGVVSG